MKQIKNNDNFNNMQSLNEYNEKVRGNFFEKKKTENDVKEIIKNIKMRLGFYSNEESDSHDIKCLENDDDNDDDDNNDDNMKNVNTNMLIQKGINRKNDIDYKDDIDENKIISLYIYFDIINIFPPNFFEIINEINLIKDIQNIFNLLIYLHEEYILLEKRNMKYKYSKIFEKIKKQNINDYPLYYYNSAKMYFPLIISSLISHSFFFIMKQYSYFILPKFHIINFYETFFSNKYLYTLCDNYVYVKILNESFIICMNILKIKNDRSLLKFLSGHKN